MMLKTMRLSWCLVVSTLLLSVAGCVLKTPYEKPDVAVPLEWKHNDTWVEAVPLEPLCHWWGVFSDPLLDELEERAMAANPNLRVAIASVEAAWTQVVRVRSALYPYVTFTPLDSQFGTSNPLSGFTNPAVSATAVQSSTMATAASPTTPASGAGAAAAMAGGVGAAPLPTATASQRRYHLRTYELPINVSYDFDLWGKQLNSWQSQIALAESEEEKFRLTQLNITTQVATAYFQLRSYDAQEKVLSDVAAAYRKAVAVNQQRYDKGLITYLDVTNAALQLSNAEANLAVVRGQRATAEDLLGTLTGTAASLFTLEAAPLVGMPPAPPSSFPGDVIRRRPDIAAAERDLYAAHLQIDVARADFFPDLQISATVGTASALLKNLLDWRARLWSYSLQMIQTIFDAGRTTAEVENAKAIYLQRLGTFEAQVLQAFQAVEDALANIEASHRQYEALERSVDAATESLNLTEDRYRRGLINSLDLIVAENNFLTVKLAVVQSLEQWYLATVNLLNALGGDWSKD